MIKKIGPLGLLTTLLFSGSAVSEDKQWWFDIEVILFSRDSGQVDEVFDPVVKPIDIQGAKPLLQNWLRPDLSYLQQMLPDCHPAEPFHLAPIAHKDGTPLWIPEPIEEEQPLAMPYWFNPVDWQQLSQLACVSNVNWFNAITRNPMPADMPVHIDGSTQIYPQGNSLLGREQLQLKSVYQQLSREQGIHPLLHLGWRQEVLFGREKAASLRLFAGHNYSDEFDYWGNHIVSEQPSPLAINQDEATSALDLVSRIEQALQTDTLPAMIKKQEEFAQQTFSGMLPEQIWQLDGLFKVYLQYINRVPYLHIDSQFNYRKPGALERQSVNSNLTQPPEQFLFSYPFKQLRRVVSQELHYFDHPYFGMIVQIRRYHIPEKPPEQAEQESQ